jgi:galactokinase
LPETFKMSGASGVGEGKGGNQDVVAAAVDKFKEVFGSAPSTGAFAPGRVNLIGEHTDYNDGFVLPFALPFRTVIVGRKADRKDNLCRIYSCTIAGADAGPIEFNANQNLSCSTPSWTNYFCGVVFQYLNELPSNVAFDAVVTSDVPLGSGLSSSASFE